ncbi:olfactory receptor 6N2-like [Gopherus evgoodei]|uniref:olfactory receptor 6N2-like n=1 Tax=Gopherus evgoodei TaxID=1825980 RepID=UPI0011CFEBDA|nr:olfactory receptor 6N2-like [Gopherus evgoodei]
MEQNNQTVVREFMLLGFTSQWMVKMSLFLVFLIIYNTSLVANSLIVALTLLDPQLHTPMYFFLCNLSCLEVFYTSVTIPKMLSNFLSRRPSITVGGCITQYYFFFSLGATECFLLATMAYDRYLAICNPLQYSGVMNHRLSLNLAIACWVCGFLSPLLPTLMISKLPFCGPDQIDHFFCDADPLFQLSCADTYIQQVAGYMLTSVVILCSFTFTIASYVHIVGALLKMSSGKEWKKPFSTCASHLTVVSIYYGTIIFMYARPGVNQSFNLGKVVSVFYTVVTPLINPMIYSLRNREMKKALRKALINIGKH